MKSFREKRFRYGTFSTAMMLFAVVIFVLVNLLAGEFNISRDLTAEQIFSLSRQSRDFLADLEQDVLITSISRTGHEHPVISQLLEEYAAASPRIRVENRDPFLSPAFVHQLAAEAGMEGGIPQDSVVVQSGGFTRVVLPQDMVQTQMGMPWEAPRVVGFNFEREITRAINHVSQGEPGIIYYVTGSGEAPLDPIFIGFLESENFIIREVDLTLHEVPADADILFVPTPNRDWSGVKAQRIRDFLDAGGRAFFALGLTMAETPNLDDLLAAFGLGFGNYELWEGDARQSFMGVPRNIIPTMHQHEITVDAQGRTFANVIPLSVSIDILPLRPAATDIEPLWTTSRDSFARVNIASESQVQLPDDIPGPFNLAVAVTQHTQIVVVGSDAFMDPWVIMNVGMGNWQFILNSLHWLQDQPSAIWVPTRVPPGAAPLILTDHEANILNGVAMGAIPLVSIGIGAFIWFRRRHN